MAVLQVCRTHTPSPMCEARAASLRRLVAGGRAVASRPRRALVFWLSLWQLLQLQCACQHIRHLSSWSLTGAAHFH